jgi:two-component system, chemotaxis family, CheB/CheR fusion protein
MSNGTRRMGIPRKGKRHTKGQSSDAPGPKGGRGGKSAPPQPPPPAPAEAAPEDAPAEAAAPAGATSGIPVIGLDGSAGALDSFKAFFEAMPPDSGAAFVVIQHLAPTHVSMLTELLAQHTHMKVAQAEDGTPVEPNCVYVIPPNEYLGIRDGVLYLARPVMEHGIRMPIGFFFRALAEDRQERAVCVFLSGAGSDGTLGVRAVRGAGGLTLAQDPQTAQYGDMPRSAIATKLVDFVLPPDQMPQSIAEYLRQPYVRGGEPASVLEAEGKPGGFNEILAVVLGKTGCDFRCYKKSTVLRRIERRMGLRPILEMAKYGELLRGDANEVAQLFKGLLINVTAFFRDADAFDELRHGAIRTMVEAKTPDDALRVWVPGCSSGEEAYSLAMLLMEEMAAAGKACPLQVFATDIDEEALESARHGLYPESIVADVGKERMARFFLRKEQGYQVCESLRSSVLFASQNLITDPPFSKMDLISCRNLLIYLDADTQARLVPLFNFALNGGGYLFLGKSEGIGGQTDLFSPVSKKARIFRRRAPGRPILLDTPIVPGKRAVPYIGMAPSRPPLAPHADAIRQAILGHFAASVVLVDRKGQILQFHGQTGKYLDMPAGEPTLNLLDIAKEGLSTRLRSALHTAFGEGRSVCWRSFPSRARSTRRSSASLSRLCRGAARRRGCWRSSSRMCPARRSSASRWGPGARAARPPSGNLRTNCGPRSRTSSPRLRSFSPPMRSCGSPTRKWSPPTRNSSPPMRNWRPPRRSCNRSTRS